MLTTLLAFSMLSDTQASSACTCSGNSEYHEATYETGENHTARIKVSANFQISCPLAQPDTSDLKWLVIEYTQDVGGFCVQFEVQETQVVSGVSASTTPRRVRIKVKNAVAGAVKEGVTNNLLALQSSRILANYKVTYDQAFNYSWPKTKLENIPVGQPSSALWYRRLDKDKKPHGSWVNWSGVPISGYPYEPDAPGTPSEGASDLSLKK